MTVPVLSTAIGERILQDNGSERVESSLIPADQLSEAKEKGARKHPSMVPVLSSEDKHS